MEKSSSYHIFKRIVDGTISLKKNSIVKKWFVNNADTEDKNKALKQIWDETEPEIGDNIEKSLQQTHQKIRNWDKKNNGNSVLSNFMRYAAIFVLPIIGGLTVWLATNTTPTNSNMVQCHVPNGEQQTIELEDGSKVQINSGSIFMYPQQFSQNQRVVYLFGEANFVVKENTQKPFIVKSGDLNIQVLGTKFNVESYPDNNKLHITLEQGSINVYKNDSPDRGIVLKPNEQLTYLKKEQSFMLSKVESAFYAAWTNDALYFRDKSLDEILVAFERHYNVHFQVDQGIKSSDLYTMKLKPHETINDALHILTQITNNISYQKEGQTIHLLSTRKEVKHNK